MIDSTNTIINKIIRAYNNNTLDYVGEDIIKDYACDIIDECANNAQLEFKPAFDRYDPSEAFIDRDSILKVKQMIC